MGTISGPSRHGHLNSATVIVRPGLGCLRLYNRIMSRIIRGQDSCDMLEMDTHNKKVDCRLSIYWTACFMG